MDRALLAAFAASAGADWALLQRGPSSIRVWTDGLGRDVDPVLLRSVERGRLVRIGVDELRRSPRTAGAGHSGWLAFVDRDRPCDRVVAGLRHERELDLARLEPLARALLARTEPAAPDPAPRLACATHDLRHLLTVAGLELERARLEAGGTSSVERACAALEDARRLCERALRPERPRARRERHDIRLVLETASRRAALVSGRADRVEVRIACEPGLLVAVDREVLERALQNLVLNAIEASPDGGRVELGASSGGGGELRVSVRDAGRGIAAEDLPELFRPGRSGSGGSGYGTESARACARELGGTLRVRSRPLGGTEILLDLPGADAEA